MNGEYDRLRQLLLDQEQDRLDALQDDLRRNRESVPDQVAAEIEQSVGGNSQTRLTRALAEATVDGLEQAVQRRPETVINAVYPVIGPAIRRSLQETLRQLSADIDRTLNAALSPRSLRWRWEAWRSGIPYAQVLLRHSAHYRVEHLFLIQPESGLLLGHLTASGLPELDADAVAGMFTAIQQFVQDSISTSKGGIGSATVGDHQLVVSEGPQARLVAFVLGLPASDFPVRLDELNESLHAQHGATWAAGEGIGAAGAGLLEQPQLDALNTDADTVAAEPRKSGGITRYLLWGTLALLVIGAAWWTVSGWRWSRQVADVQRHLENMPGMLVTRLDADKRGTLRIDGLRDALSADPQAWLAQAYPQVKAEWRLRGFFSTDPEMTTARVAQMLAIPNDRVSVPDAQGVVRLQGELPFIDWYRVHKQAPLLTLPGMSRLEASALTYPQQARVESLARPLETLTVPFASGASMPEPGWQDPVARIAAAVENLQRLHADGIAFEVRTCGLADSGGSGEQNYGLRRKRAEWLAAQLADTVREPSGIVIESPATATTATNLRGARAIVVPVPAQTVAR